MAKHGVSVGRKSTTKECTEVHKSRDKAKDHHKEIKQSTKLSKKKIPNEGKRGTVAGILN